MKFIRKFFVMFMAIYLSIPLIADLFILVGSFLVWTPIHFDRMLMILNPANSLVMRLWMFISSIFAIVVTYNNRNSDQYWW